MGGERLDRRGPTREDFVALAAIDADPERSADVVQNNLRIRERPCEIRDIIDLWMIEPRVEREAQAAEYRKSFAECFVSQQSGRGWIRLIIDVSASHAVMWRIPRKRSPPARASATKTGSTRLPSVKSACPTMPAQALVLPQYPLAHMAATPLMNSVSPTGRISIGPESRYIERERTR